MFFRKNEDGQVLVEAAIVMPLMVFFTLGIMQMTMMQQAKIMVDYAAYAAARSGVVNNASPIGMEAAANIAVLPSYARTNSLKTLAKAYLMYTIGSFLKEKMEDILGGVGNIPFVTAFVHAKLSSYLAQLGINTFGFATVVVTNPLFGDFEDMKSKNSSGNPWEPSSKVSTADDFDNLNESVAIQRTSRGITNRDKNILTVAVSFNYELKIPFANWVIFEIWSATQVGLRLTGAIWSSRAKVEGWAGSLTGNANATGGGGMIKRSWSRNLMRLKMHTDDNGGNPLRVFQKIRTPLSLLWELNEQSIYIIPIYGTYSMRMHSNVYKSNLSEEAETLLMQD